MSVDTPVLERRTQDTERDFQSYFRYNNQTADIQAEDAHNARIRDNYAKLINPRNNIEDVFNRAQQPVAEEEKAEEAVKPAEPIVQQRPYLVRNARADSEIFRADSPINQRLAARQMTFADVKAEVNSEDEDEENEDLRPTATTIQYRTVTNVKKQTAEMNASRFALTKSQKIAIVAAIAVVITLITLIIINAVIISGLNAEISELNSELENITEKITTVKSDMLTLRGAYAGVSDGVTGQVILELSVLNY